MSTNLRVVFPLPASFGSEPEHKTDRLEVILKPIGNPNEFKLQDIATRLDANLQEDTKHRQTYVLSAKGEKIGVSAFLYVKDEAFNSGNLELTIEHQLQFDAGLIANDGQGDPLRILLRGSISISASGLLNGADDEFKAHIASLWPTQSLQDVVELRLEPSGLHLVGRMPNDFYSLWALGASNGQHGQGPKIVLRVPQQKSDENEWKLPTFRFSREKPDEEVLSQPGFKFDDNFIMDACAFVTSWKRGFEAFRALKKTFLDNLVCEPDADCQVTIGVSKDSIAWKAERIGTRINLGVAGESEASFFPELLEGKLKNEGGQFVSDGDVAFVSGASAQAVEFETRTGVRLKQTVAGTLVLEFDSLACTGVSVPSTLLSDANGRLVLDKPRKLNDPKAKPPIKDLLVEQPLRRSWLCTNTGWICLDSLEPTAKLKDPDDIPPSDAMRSPIPISAWMERLKPNITDEPASGMIVELEAIGRTNRQQNEQTRLELRLSSDGTILSFVVIGAKTILQTPPVWFSAPLSPNANKSDRTDQPVPRSQTPSLTADSSGNPTFDLEKHVHGSLVAASFFSNNVLASDDLQLEDVDGGAARQLNVTVTWSNNDSTFKFAFEKSPLTIWTAPSDLPILQTAPLSPISQTDMYLDANRGLIPYKPRNLGDGNIEVLFPPQELPKLEALPDAPHAPLPNAADDPNWEVPTELGRVRFFLPTLPGLEANFTRNGTSNAIWSYRQAVPVLDEAYTEIVEAANSDQVTVPVEHTRVAGTVAFEIGKIGESVDAEGWLLPEGRNGADRKTPVKLKAIDLNGRSPSLQFEMSDAGDRRITFSRPDFPATNIGQSELTLGMKAKQVPDGTLPAFDVKWDGDVADKQLVDSDWPRPIRVLNNGQPLVAQRLPNGRVVTLDGEGVVRVEPVGNPARIVERRPDGTFRETATASWQISETMHLDVAAIVVNLNADEDTERFGHWTLHNGSGSWPTWRNITLLPLRLSRFDTAGAGYKIVLEVAPLWRPPTQKDAADVLEDWAKQWTLTFEASDEKNATLKSIEGELDWRFSGLPAKPDSDANKSPVKLVRIVAGILKPDVPSLEDNQECELTITELAFEHKDIGLVRTTPASGRLGLTSTGLATFSVSNRQSEHAYELKGEFQLANNAPNGITAFSLEWFGIQNDGPSWTLTQAKSTETENNNVYPWQFRLKQDNTDLIVPAKVNPNRVGPRKFLFQVVKTDPIASADLPDFDPAKPTWFALEQTTGGFIGIEFGPSPEANGELVVRDIAAELQVLIVDAKFRTNDSVHIYDPSSDKNELITIDRDTGDIFEPDQLSDVGVAADSNSQVLWGTRNRGLQRWQRKLNVVDTRIDIGQNTEPIALPTRKVVIDGVEKTINIDVRSIGILTENKTVILDGDGNLRYWDFDDPLGPRLPTNGEELREIIEKENPDDFLEFSVTQTLVTSRRLKSDIDNFVVAWSRTKKDGTGSFVRVWDRSTDPLAKSPQMDSIHNDVIEAIDILPGKSLVSGDKSGVIKVWKKLAPGGPAGFKVSQTLNHDSPVSAITAIGDSDDNLPWFVSANQKSENGEFFLKLWDNTVLNDGKPLHFLQLSQGVKSLAALKDGSNKYRLAILFEDGSVAVTSLIRSDSGSPEFAGPPESLDLRGTRADSITQLPDNTLLISGKALQTRLNGLLRLQRANSQDRLTLEASGWVTLENDVRFQDSVMLPVGGGQTAPLKVDCTHKARFHFDRTQLPLSAIFMGRGPDVSDEFVAGVVEHTFRFGRDPQKPNELVQVERIWQNAQRIRLSTLERTRKTLLPGGAPLPESQKQLLAIDASSVVWLAWAEPSGLGSDRDQSSSEISAPGLRIRLRARRVGRFQSSESMRNAARIVRIPFVAVPGWIRLLPPQDNVIGGSPTAFHRISIPQDVPDADVDEKLHPTSGVQPALLRLPNPPDESRVEYVRRTLQARIDPRAVHSRPVDFRDALWLDEQFLAAALVPGDQFQDVKELDLAHQGGAVPVWNDGVALPKSMEDLRWLRVWKPRSHEAPGADGVEPTQRPATPGTVKARRQRPQLLAATVTRKHDPDMGPQPLFGPTILEFPYELEAIPEQVTPTNGQANATPLETPSTLDVQLVVFERGRLVRIASDRIQVTGDDEKNKETAAEWGRQVMLARRRNDASFVLIDLRIAVPTPFSPEAARAELTSAYPWSASAEIPDPRRRVPISSGVFPPGNTNMLSTVGAPENSILMFDADPEPRVDPFPGIAATRFRLAPRHSGGKAVLHAARSSALLQNEKANIFACTSRDEVPFELVAHETKPYPYPQVDPAALSERGVPSQDALSLKSEENASIQTLWPPLWDCVSWAARPGESYRTFWNLERLEFESPTRIIRHLGSITSALLRRPRALAAKTQSVRLSFAPKISEDTHNPRSIFNGRFRAANFLFMQILDRTNPPTGSGLSMVLTTRSEVFRGASAINEAKALPARAYATSKTGNTAARVSDSEQFVVHLIPGQAYLPTKDDTAVPANPPTQRTFLVWLKDPLKDSAIVDEASSTIKDVSDTKVIGEIKRLPEPAESGNGWIYDADCRVFRLEVILDFSKAKSPKNNLPPNPDSPVGNASVWTLAAIVFERVPIEGDPGNFNYKASSEVAAVTVAFFDSAGKLRAPKTSVSILAESKGLLNKTMIAGYGRLSDELFDPVQPQLVKTDQNVVIEWRRTAGLNVLHRATKDTQYIYDVVAYGSGGEVFPTEPNHPEG